MCFHEAQDCFYKTILIVPEATCSYGNDLFKLLNLKIYKIIPEFSYKFIDKQIFLSIKI